MAKKDKEQQEEGGVATLAKRRLRKKYADEVVPKLMEQFSYKSSMQLPRLEKIVVNMGTGSKEKTSDKHQENSIRDLTLITGQKPIITKAKKAVSNFKI